MRDTLGPIAEILQEAGDFEAAAKVLCEWLGVSAAPDGREAFCKLLETSPAGIACALDFSLDTKGHWFGDHNSTATRSTASSRSRPKSIDGRRSSA